MIGVTDDTRAAAVPSRLRPPFFCSYWLALCSLLGMGLHAAPAAAQLVPDDPLTPASAGETPRPLTPGDAAPATPTAVVAAVRVEGNETIPEDAVLRKVNTHPGRPADPKTIREDVLRLYETRWFSSAEPHYRYTEQGMVVVFKVVERPMVEYIEYRFKTEDDKKSMKIKYLQNLTGLRPGSPYDIISNIESARRIQQELREKGYVFAEVTLISGSKPQERDVIFLINAGPKVKVHDIKFEGNDGFSDALLQTKIRSKERFLWLIGGKYDPSTVPDDLDALKQYYHSLGYFDVKVDKQINFNDDRDGVELVYQISEGMRYKVRNIELNGNQLFSNGDLRSMFRAQEGEYFNSRLLDKDVTEMKERYDDLGRIFAEIEAKPRYLDQPGVLDIVYNINEDRVYRIRRVNIHIQGEYPHTKESVARNRILTHPGDLAVGYKIRRSKSRLSGGNIFMGGPIDGPKMQITRVEDNWSDPEHIQRIASDAAPNSVVRGQNQTDAPPWPQQSAQPPSPQRQPAALTPTSHQQPAPAQQTPYTRPPYSQQPQYEPAPPRPQYTQPPAPQQAEPQARFEQPVYRVPAPRQPAPPQPRVQSNWKPVYTPAMEQQLASAPPTFLPPIQQPASVPLNPEEGMPAAPQFAQLEPEPQRSFFLEPGLIIRGQNYDQFGNPQDQSTAPFYGSDPSGDPLANSLPIEPPGYIDLDYYVNENRTGRLMFGVGVNSDAGVVGSIVFEEYNFDILRPATSWRDVLDGTAWRGAGQHFRVEAVPGSQVSRYMVSWTDPYFINTDNSLGLSGFYFSRFYPDWDETRAGGRITLGRQLTDEISISGALRLEDVEISNPDQPTPDLLADVVGNNTLSTFTASIAHDTRDAAFLPTEGHYLRASAEQAFGEFNYTQTGLEARQYFTTWSRADGTGKQVLSVGGDLGFTGEDTPIFERYFAGGFQTFRGFAFRGVSPRENGVRIGGRFQMLGSIEYKVPVTANEMIGVVGFTDFGTVETDVGLDDFRVTAGFGFRLAVPAMGPVPLAFDFAFPILSQPEDDERIFSFYIGLSR